MEKPSIYDSESCRRYIERQKAVDNRREEVSRRVERMRECEDGISAYNLDQVRRMRDD
jgi:hypothetical protein